MARVFDLLKEVFYHYQITEVVCMLRRQVDCLLIDYHVCVDRIEGHELIVGGRQPKQKEA